MIVLLLALLVAAPAYAVQPDEMLADPALEARARSISKELRCLVCRNESIDDSNAELARDLRILVRERLVAGVSDAEAVAFLVDRYGEYVLLSPPAKGANILLWLAGPGLLVVALGMGLIYVRRRSAAGARGEAPVLSAEEEARLKEIMQD